MKKIFSILFAGLLILSSCNGSKNVEQAQNLADSTKIAHPEWVENAVIYEVNWRQMTDDGTIAAFEQNLPRLKELGVDILWFMPVFPISELNRKGTLGSYYAVKDYTDVNPELGTLEQFKAMVNKAHELGMKVILDWVPNHSGCDNAWVAEHPDWYARNDEGNMYGPYDWTDVFKFDYSNPEMRKGMADALKFWLTEVDVDGFRMDVAGEVPTDFWNELRPQLDSIKPVFMLAEASKPELSFEAFDMSYNWPMKDLQNMISRTNGQNKYADEHNTHGDIKHAVAIDSLLADQAANYATGSILMNMITNHDLNSWEGTEFERYGDGVETFAVLTYTLPGMPLIYTGQEVGMDRAFEFFEKDKAPDFTPNATTAFYQKLNQLKHNTSALNATTGAPMKRFPTESDDAYVFSRTNDDGGVVVFLNLSGNDVELNYSGVAPDGKDGVNYFTGETEEFPTSLKPWEYKVYTVK